MLLVFFCCVWFFLQASDCALILLKHGPWIPSEAPFGGLNILWLSSVSCPCLCLQSGAGGRGGTSFTAPACCVPDGLHGPCPCSAFEALKKYLWVVWKRRVFSSCHLIPTLNCFIFKGRNLKCQGGCFSSFLKDESDSTKFPWLSLCWSKNTDLSS